MIRTMLFDLGNVLLYFSHERMCEQIGSLCDRSADEVRALVFDSGLQLRFERGELTPEEFHQTLEESVGQSLDIDALRIAGSDIFEVNSSAVELLGDLKSLNLRLVLLSNICASHFEFVVENFAILEPFDEVLASFQVGAVKPESAIFEAALRAIQCDPQECFYTDDIAEYVQASRGFGLQAEVFQGTEALRAHLVARGVPLPTPQSIRETSD